jgi:hypothetical protein
LLFFSFIKQDLDDYESIDKPGTRTWQKVTHFYVASHTENPPTLYHETSVESVPKKADQVAGTQSQDDDLINFFFTDISFFDLVFS